MRRAASEVFVQPVVGSGLEGRCPGGGSALEPKGFLYLRDTWMHPQTATFSGGDHCEVRHAMRCTRGQRLDPNA